MYNKSVYLFIVVSLFANSVWIHHNGRQDSQNSFSDEIFAPPLTRVENGVTTTAIAGGDGHTCALLSTGGLKCWGQNDLGKVGDGTDIHRYIPADVVDLGSGVTAFSVGGMHSCALLSSGGVKCWGSNGNGQLGDGTNTDRFTPVDVDGLSSGVTAISAGGYHTCALLDTGGIKCWGANFYGQLGDGTNTWRNTPVDVVGLSSGVEAIAAGGEHSCALLSEGVQCWGRNDFGGLGDDTTTSRNVPVDVAGLGSEVDAITAGFFHSCALLSTDGIKCWGYNVNGQLGDNTTTQRNTPVDVDGLSSGVQAIDAGYWHSCAMLSTDEVKCWGDNRWGQLGDGTNTDQSAPVTVIGLSGPAAAISAGGWHNCALLSTGESQCWGHNGWGQLGDGTTTSSNSPMDVIGLTAAPPEHDSVGLHNQDGCTYFLKYLNEGGEADVGFTFGCVGGDWIAVMGDWDGDGVDTAGIYEPATSSFFLKNSNEGGAADLGFQFGASGIGWLPIAGDWNGDGIDTVGVYDPRTSTFHLKNSHSGGLADISFQFGAADMGWLPLSGDWDGDDVDTVGVYNHWIAAYYLRNSNSNGGPDIVFQYGAVDPTWVPLMGDWDGDGIDTVGVYVSNSATFYLKNTNENGESNLGFQYGPAGAGWVPMSGNFE